MKIFLGSENPVKINAVIEASSETWPDVQVVGCSVPSGVSDQPFSDEETQQGSINRAKIALEDGLAELKKNHLNYNQDEVLGVGLEGGVTEQSGELWNTVWCTVVDINGNAFTVNGARFKLDDEIAEQLRLGTELGHVMAQMTGEDNVKQKRGLIGILTNNFIDRTEEYASLAKLALGLWYGRHWKKMLSTER